MKGFPPKTTTQRKSAFHVSYHLYPESMSSTKGWVFHLIPVEEAERDKKVELEIICTIALEVFFPDFNDDPLRFF